MMKRTEYQKELHGLSYEDASDRYSKAIYAEMLAMDAFADMQTQLGSISLDQRRSITIAQIDAEARRQAYEYAMGI